MYQCTVCRLIPSYRYDSNCFDHAILSIYSGDDLGIQSLVRAVLWLPCHLSALKSPYF